MVDDHRRQVAELLAFKVLQRYAAAYKLEIAHFFEVLQNGGTFRTTVDDGVKAQILADAATESAKSGQPITF